MTDVTSILTAIDKGDARAAEELLPAVYGELRKLANQKLARESPGQTLQATDLVHEAYIRLVGNDKAGFQSRAHFFAAAAEAMRRILIDRARHKQALKSGAKHDRVELHQLDQLPETAETSYDDLLALDEALAKLEREDKTKAELVRLRYFAGLTVRQAADLMGISRATADRYWTYARAFLLHEVASGSSRNA